MQRQVVEQIRVASEIRLRATEPEFRRIAYDRGMALDEMHPFVDSEVKQVSRECGVLVLFQIQIPIHVEAAQDLRKGLQAARTKFPRASHFAVETSENQAAMQDRLRELQRQMTRVRAATFFDQGGPPTRTT